MVFQVGELVQDVASGLEYVIVIPQFKHEGRERVVAAAANNSNFLFVMYAENFEPIPAESKFKKGQKVLSPMGDPFTVVESFPSDSGVFYYVVRTRGGALSFYSEHSLKPTPDFPRVGAYFEYKDNADDNKRRITKINKDNGTVSYVIETDWADLEYLAQFSEIEEVFPL